MKLYKATLAIAALLLLFTQSTAAAGSSDVNEWEVEKEIYFEINEERYNNGLNGLNYNPGLSDAASEHSDRMAERGSLFHTSNLLSSFRDEGVSCNLAAENVAYTYHVGKSDAEVADRLVEMWMGSSGHRHNVLNGNYDQTGIAVTTVGPYTVATQNFCR